MTVFEMIQNAEVKHRRTFSDLIRGVEKVADAEIWRLEAFHKIHIVRANRNITIKEAIEIIESKGENMKNAKERSEEELQNEIEKTLGAIYLCRKVNKAYEKRR